MAKAMKKSSKKSQKTTPVKSEPTEPKAVRKAPEALPVLPEGTVTVVMHKDDLRALSNLLSLCAQTFEGLAMNAAKENDEKSFNILQARQQLSAAFAQRMVAAYGMPEPISREFH